MRKHVVSKEVVDDAARFRWLLNGNGYFMEHEYLCGGGHSTEEERAEARRKIDAAMQEECNE